MSGATFVQNVMAQRCSVGSRWRKRETQRGKWTRAEVLEDKIRGISERALEREV